MSDINILVPDSVETEKKKNIVLTDEQKKIIIEAMEKNPERPPTVKDLISIVFNKPADLCDARQQEGISIRKYIAEVGLKFRNAREWLPEKTIILTEEQKIFITNNCNSIKPLEIARVLFKNENITMLDVETREVYKYIKTLPTAVLNTSSKPDEEINTEDYKPPKTDEQTIARINKYVNNANLNKKDLTEKQKRDTKSLIGYLHTMRYLSQISTYAKSHERDLFESEFIRCTYDKSLTEEEVSQYVIYCTEVIIAKQISKRIQDLEEEQDRQMDENNGRLSMTLVEAIGSLRDEYNQCITRQKSSLKSLQGERKERLKIDHQNKGNISDLIVYAQSEEKRLHLLKIADARRIKIKDEIYRIKNIDEIKAEIFGVSPEEILD